MAEPLLDVQDIRTYFSTEEGVVRAVDGVSFSVDAQERRGVVGESGSGKSQSALAILGLLPKQATVSGSIVFDGQQTTGASNGEVNSKSLPKRCTSPGRSIELINGLR